MVKNVRGLSPTRRNFSSNINKMRGSHLKKVTPSLHYRGSQMKPVNREKHVWEKLNKRQEQAIHHAQQGDCFPLIQCCLECHKAEDKALKAIELGSPLWGQNTALHYRQIRCYLETFMDNDTSWQAYQQMVESRCNNG